MNATAINYAPSKEEQAIAAKEAFIRSAYFAGLLTKSADIKLARALIARKGS